MKEKRVYRRYRFSSSGICLGYTEHSHTNWETVKLWALSLFVIGSIMFCGYIAATTNIPSLKVTPTNDFLANGH